jgi:hypothetical protein
VFPVRYKLNSYIFSRSNSAFKGLREEIKFRVLENRMPRRIFGPDRGHVTGRCRCIMRTFILEQILLGL